MPTTAYSIKFIGHIKEPRPLGWPERVEQDVYVEVEGLEGLKAATSANLVHIIRVNGGMIVVKESFRTAIQKTGFTPDIQSFIPIHMISHITTETKRIVGSFPDDSEKDKRVKQ